jgi:hypothetical protein
MPKSSIEVVVEGQYVVYERASKGEDRFFLDIAEEVVSEIEEPANWRRKKERGRRGGGRPCEYGFREMLIVLMLMVYHRKEYREMEAYLRNDPLLLTELGMKRAPSKSTIHSAASRIGLDTLSAVNDSIVAKFKKTLEELERST